MDPIDQEGESISSRGELAESSKGGQVKEIQITSHSIREERLNSIKGTRPPPLQILDQVKLNNTVETPRSTIKGFLNPQSTELNFTRENLKRAEQKLKQAFVEFYHKLHLLKSYRYKSHFNYYSIWFLAYP